MLKPHDFMSFGKNQGKVLAEIYKYQPSYLEWAILNNKHFKIDIVAFEKLPTPTTIGYKKNHFINDINFKEETNKKKLWDFISNIDSTNHFYDVDEIKKMISEGFEIDVFNEFKFPKHIVDYNNSK
ncbi:hypothetical protein [Flavobacterium sp.]|uniref:exodeoxyribonuclease X C-terminal domain-containing protein n=1 Tax=Flavobacterium sp. TaxID=239 RepID=UPI0039E719CA